MNPADHPDIFDGLPCHWAGVDDTTPAGCMLFVTTVLGLVTTYVLRDGQVIGRVENDGGRLCGYVGQGLKGGQFVGLGHSSQLAQKIADATA